MGENWRKWVERFTKHLKVTWPTIRRDTSRTPSLPGKEGLSLDQISKSTRSTRVKRNRGLEEKRRSAMDPGKILKWNLIDCWADMDLLRRWLRMGKGAVCGASDNHKNKTRPLKVCASWMDHEDEHSFNNMDELRGPLKDLRVWRYWKLMASVIRRTRVTMRTRSWVDLLTKVALKLSWSTSRESSKKQQFPHSASDYCRQEGHIWVRLQNLGMQWAKDNWLTSFKSKILCHRKR
jgi:hypothetical protein